MVKSKQYNGGNPFARAVPRLARVGSNPAVRKKVGAFTIDTVIGAYGKLGQNAHNVHPFESTAARYLAGQWSQRATEPADDGRRQNLVAAHGGVDPG